MSVRLHAAVDIDAPVQHAWDRLVDWEGQAEWIPLTTVRVQAGPPDAVGARVVALSGFQLGRRSVGLLDRFVVTARTPPYGGVPGELAVLHLGPYFTGPGAFCVEEVGRNRTRVSCTEVFDLPGGRLVELLARASLPVLRPLLRHSLRRLGRVAGSRSR